MLNTDVKQFILDEFLISNSCTNNQCYICNKANNEYPHILERKAKQAERTRKIMKKRGIEKFLRFEALISRAIHYEMI